MIKKLLSLFLVLMLASPALAVKKTLGTNQLVASGSVTQANMKVSAVDGTAFIDTGSNIFDNFTKSLLHFDGTNASTIFNDQVENTWTVIGAAQISTVQSKFGGASGLFDGSSAAIYSTNSNFSLGTDKWTVDLWIRPTSFAIESTLFDLLIYGGNGGRNDAVIIVINQTTGTLRPFTKGSYGSSTVNALTINNWNHVAVVFDGTKLLYFINGVLDTTQPSFNTNITSGGCTLGQIANAPGYYLTGNIDEFRVSKGIARWTASFTPSTIAYDVLPFNLNNLLIVKDSSGNAIQGWIKAAGTGEILDATNLVVSWTNVNYDSFTSIASPDITSAIYTTSGTQTGASNSMATTVGKLYKLVATWTNVTGQAPTLVGTNGFVTTVLGAGANNIYFVATGTSVVLTVSNTAAVSWGCTFILKQVTTPATTGTTITSTKGEVTYNFQYKHASFNYNDSSGYTYRIYKVW